MMTDSEISRDLINNSSRSPMERKNCLKRVLEQTLVLHEVIDNTTINKLDEAVNKADNVTHETSVQEKICNQQEVLYDSQLMTLSAKVLKTCTVSLTKRMHDYDDVDFAKRLVKYFQEISNDPQPPNWSLLLKTRVTKSFKRTPNYTTLLGTLEPLEKKAIIRKKSERTAASQAAMIVPDKLASHTNTDDEDSVEQTVRKIRKLIICYCKETQKPLDFFQLILHPHDFGKTVRNLLYISFLVKDGLIQLKKENTNLVVQPCRKAGKQSDDRKNIQSVVSLNMKQWMILKQAYGLNSPMINFEEK